MNRILLTFATLLFVACGNKVAQPEPAEVDNLSDNLPEYEFLSTEEPRVSPDGHISPGQNLIYNIEIEHPLQKDSLELIQDYFIQKGEADFVGINKIIVRAYLKGTTIHRTPYASMNLVGGKKEIIINDAAIEIEKLSQEPSTEKVQETADPLVGTYFCNRTHDTYVFKSDKTGFFTIQGGSPSTFTWKRSGSNVTIVYEAFGEQKLKFDQSAETLTEKSESFGTLVFNKQ
ncbi:MAG: hypothetical protein IJ562_06425 [Prevotella sp.]|nr:hypothetical protein [Prevotella sp.]